MVADVDATFAIEGGLEDACKRLADEAELAVRAGTGVIVVSDVAVGPERVPVPILLAVGAVDERLVQPALDPESYVRKVIRKARRRPLGAGDTEGTAFGYPVPPGLLEAEYAARESQEDEED